MIYDFLLVINILAVSRSFSVHNLCSHFQQQDDVRALLIMVD